MGKPRLTEDNIVFGVSETTCLFWDSQTSRGIIGPVGCTYDRLIIRLHGMYIKLCPFKNGLRLPKARACVTRDWYVWHMELASVYRKPTPWTY